jgi:hypothetical protein
MNQDRKTIFNEAKVLLTNVSMLKPRTSEKYERLFESEMLRYISYLIKVTPRMATINSHDVEKFKIFSWLAAFTPQSYDVACSALMTSAVDMFTH